MSLEAYKKKRSFNKTPEPVGGKNKTKDLIFVIQKHQASHLHYDFRLEMKGALKSWAVPKGPSTNPEERRLAQLVEDHPFDYKDFEGIIPEGNYGAGTVIIWDQGTYQPKESTGNKEQDEKLLIKQFYSGKISIVLKGKKLKGTFNLMKTPARSDNAWLLSKSNDRFASEKNIADKDASVISGLTIEQMAENDSAATWKSNRSANSNGNNTKRSASHKPVGLLSESSKRNVEEDKEIETKNGHPVNSHNKKSSATKSDQVAIWKHLHPSAEAEETETIKVERKEIILINYEQEYWTGITKLHLVLYYQSIASYILPYLQNRPLGLNIVNKWAGEKEARFVRNMKSNYPKWVDIFTTERRISVQGKSEEIDWVVCNDLATLIYLLNLGALDLHPWSANIKSSNEPDYIVIDLDPDDTNEEDRSANTKNFKNVIKVALAAKEFFDEQGLVSFIKTSGKTGMHLLLPCKGIEYGDTRMIAENICENIHQRVPSISTINTSTHSRGGKVYIDASQNDYGDRLVAAYSVRAYKQPYVSTPLSWDEVNLKLNRHVFTIHTIKERLNQKGDLFDGLFDAKIQKQNTAVLKKLVSAEK
jgi:DNA ligase D-like protein (predicted 3'-phosphoesterase)/DNA ligase D-like protein (predicted polymerase)